jgi:hypothetical protein
MSECDQELSRTLKTWRHEPPAAPRFNAEVWTRIDAAREAPWAFAAFIGSRLGIPARHFRWALPLGASLMLTLAAVAGVGVGSLQASHSVNDRMAAAYVRTIDPLQMKMDQGQR